MVQLSDIHPITDFTRRTKEYIERLKETGKPEVLTVNGEARLSFKARRISEAFGGR